MPPKLKRVSAGESGVNIDRGLKLTAIDDSCSPSNAVTSCDGYIAASARSCVVEDVSFAETNGATEQRVFGFFIGFRTACLFYRERSS